MQLISAPERRGSAPRKERKHERKECRLANEKNLTHHLTASEQREGGKNSAISRKRKKAIHSLLTEFLDKRPGKVEQAVRIAQKYGIKAAETVKEVFVVACVINSLQDAKLKDLELLMHLAGEKIEESQDEGAPSEFNISSIEIFQKVNADVPDGNNRKRMKQKSAPYGRKNYE